MNASENYCTSCTVITAPAFSFVNFEAKLMVMLHLQTCENGYDDTGNSY